MKKNSFVEGTIIASIAIIITKILGILYVIPFYSIIGENGGTLYSYAYNIYNLFLNISTAGIPIAISMIISEYSALNLNEAKNRAYSISKKIIVTFSIIAFLFLFIFADSFGLFFLKGIEGSNSISDVALVIRAISLCLLITPFLSILRGYLQGHKFIAPTATSQIIEQVVRIIVILLGSYISINICNSSVPVGVAVALTGAFFGGLVAYLYLKIKVNKDKKLIVKPKTKDNITNKEIITKIISYSLPVIITAIIGNLYDIIDMKLIIKGLYKIGYDAKTCELISSIITTWAPKICMIMNAVSIGLTTSLIPHIIDNFVKNEIKEVNHKFNNAIETFLVLSIPMATGIFLLANPIYKLFYGENYYGPLILKFLAILNTLLGLLMVINTCLQGMKKFKIIYLNTLIGLIINAILDVPLIVLFKKIGWYPFYGSIVATIIGVLISMITIYIYFKKEFKFNFKPILKTVKKIILPITSMIIVVEILKHIIPFNNLSYSLLILSLLLIVIVGAITYIFLIYKNNGLYTVFGKEYVDDKLKKLHLKK